MAHYEVVALKGKGGCDYQSADDLREAKDRRDVLSIVNPPYDSIFIRQYRTDKFRGETFRVLHKLTWRNPAA